MTILGKCTQVLRDDAKKKKKNAKRKRVRCIVKEKCAPVNTGYLLNGQRGLEAAGSEVYRLYGSTAANARANSLKAHVINFRGTTLQAAVLRVSGQGVGNVYAGGFVASHSAAGGLRLHSISVRHSRDIGVC